MAPAKKTEQVEVEAESTYEAPPEVKLVGEAEEAKSRFVGFFTDEEMREFWRRNAFRFGISTASLIVSGPFAAGVAAYNLAEAGLDYKRLTAARDTAQTED